MTVPVVQISRDGSIPSSGLAGLSALAMDGAWGHGSGGPGWQACYGPLKVFILTP